MATKREALIASAEKSVQKGKVDAALKDYLKVLEEAPNDINILNKVGDLNVRLGKNEDSIPFFLRIAEHYARDGFYVRAIAMYKKINKLDPARLDIYEKLAELYVKQQLWMEAKSNYQVLADYLLKQDNLAGTIGIYQKMVSIEPQNLQLHVKLADLFTQAKRIPEALREYAIVAAALSERGAHEESIRVYEKALKLAPDNVDILRTLVPLLLSINSVDQARAVLRRGLEASPRSVQLFLLSAEAALAANDMAEARSFSDKARAVDPENEDVLAAAVRIQLKGRRPDLAWSAAAPLADAAVRRGEAKKALAILVPIARAAPDSDEVVKKIVDIAAGTGDEATALPYRSALAELYRKKGKLAEAADLLRHCSRLQPDNAEFRSRLAQLEPHAGVLSVAPARVPPPTLERRLEVTLSGFEAQHPRSPAPPEPAPPPVVVSEPVPSAEEFEFDLDEVEQVEAPGPAIPDEVPAAPATPPRGLGAPLPADLAAAELESEPVWNSLSAAEALEAYEAREAAAARATPQAGSIPIGAIEELHPGSDFQVVPSSDFAATEFPPIDFGLSPPDGFGPGVDLEAGSFPGPAVPAAGLSEVAWPSTSLPGEEAGGPSTFGPVSRPVSGDAALEDALVESDVFRRYGLLEKAVDQLRPWLERAPANLRVREKLFEIHLEQGHRDEAREQAVVLAESYGVAGREDRIRGLEALLGEPLREPAAAGGIAAAAAPPEEEIAAAEEPSGGALAAPEFEPDLSLATDLELPEMSELPAAGLPSFVSTLPEEPLTEVISAFAEPLPYVEEAAEVSAAAAAEPDLQFEEAVPAPQAVAPVVEAIDVEALDVEAPVVEAPVVETPIVEAPVMEALVGPPSAARAEPPTAPRVEPTPPTAAEPISRAVPDRRAAPRTKLSTEDVLGLGKAGAPTQTKKVKTVRPEDVELDLLGAKGTKAKPKQAAKAEAVLPDDLLRALRKPGSVQAHSASPPTQGAREPSAEPPFPSASAAAATAGGEEGLLALVHSGAPSAEAPAPSAPPAELAPEELSALDFCLDQGMVVDAAERLQSLEGRFPGDSELAARRLRLEGGRGGAEVTRAALHDILSDDLDSVLDAELGRALTEDMVRDLPPPQPPAQPAAAGAPVMDESGLFSDEQEFFNFADELHTELRREGEAAPGIEGEEGKEVSLEEIFRDFKKGVEQQLSPEDYETHYNLGIAYKEMGLTDEAIGEFQLAAKDPLHAVECCSMLGLCFLEKGLPQLSVKWYRKGLETMGVKEEDRLGLQYALAGVLEQIGDRDGAYRTYLDIYGANANFRDVPTRLKELKPFVAS